MQFYSSSRSIFKNIGVTKQSSKSKGKYGKLLKFYSIEARGGGGEVNRF